MIHNVVVNRSNDSPIVDGFSFPEAIELGCISPGIALVYYRSNFHICYGDGHHMLVTFPIDPSFIYMEDESDEVIEALDDRLFYAQIDALNLCSKSLIVPLQESDKLLTSIKELTDFLNKEQSIDSWIIDRCGALIDLYRKTYPTILPEKQSLSDVLYILEQSNLNTQIIRIKYSMFCPFHKNLMCNRTGEYCNGKDFPDGCILNKGPIVIQKILDIK